MKKQKPTSNKPKGLVNLGNTCYFNSIMQVLLNAPLFGPVLVERSDGSNNKYILDAPNKDEQIEFELPSCDYSIKAIVDLYKNYSSSSTQAIAPSKVISAIREKTGRFHRNLQEDSHELLRSLLDIIRSDEINRQKKAIELSKLDVKTHCFTLIDFIFGGYFLSSVQCQKCKFKSEHFEPYFDLSLAITDPIKNIRVAISNFFSNAILDGDNKFMCQRCTKVNGKKTYEAGIKSTKIAVPSNILTLHLKRFEANSSSCLGGRRKCNARNNPIGNKSNKNNKYNKKKSGNDDDDDSYACGSGGDGYRKINKQIEFTEFLDISGYTDDICYNLTKVNSWPKMNRGQPIWYSLIGVVNHSGMLKGGHYTAYVKYEDSNDYFISKEFCEFIQNHPYLPDLIEVEQIRNIIKQEDLKHCRTTNLYNDDINSDIDDDSSVDSDDKIRPNSIPGSWYHISDSSVRNATLAEVLSSQAYLLFYRRVMDHE